MDIWSRPAYLPYVQPQLTESMIHDAERKMGVKLPKEYLDILRIQNGGYIRYTHLDIHNESISGIGPYYSSITDFEWLEEYDNLPFDVKNLFPFDGDGHWNVCLDYRKNINEPQITIIDTETEEEKVIAQSFKEFLKAMVVDTEENYVIETNSTLERIVEQISELANVDFSKPNDFANGFLQYTGTYKESWVWVSPNKVPCGFIRKDEERFDELKSEMLKMTVRHPEVPENSLIISVSNESVKQELFDILKAQQVSIKALKAYF